MSDIETDEDNQIPVRKGFSKAHMLTHTIKF